MLYRAEAFLKVDVPPEDVGGGQSDAHAAGRVVAAWSTDDDVVAIINKTLCEWEDNGRVGTDTVVVCDIDDGFELGHGHGEEGALGD